MLALSKPFVLASCLDTERPLTLSIILALCAFITTIIQVVVIANTTAIVHFSIRQGEVKVAFKLREVPIDLSSAQAFTAVGEFLKLRVRHCERGE